MWRNASIRVRPAADVQPTPAPVAIEAASVAEDATGQQAEA